VVKALISGRRRRWHRCCVQYPDRRDHVRDGGGIGDLNQRLVGAIVVASVAAAVVERAILGGRPSLTVPGYTLGNWQELFAYAALGGFAGIGATGFVRGLLMLRLFMRDRMTLPRWAAPAVGGVGMAAIGLLLPQTFGIGYPTLSAALLGELSWRRMAVLTVGKSVATITSSGCGLAALSPTLPSAPCSAQWRTWSIRSPGRAARWSGRSPW
jgi:H+/Cl- antiporter ClcA